MLRSFTLHEDQWFTEQLASIGREVFVYRLGGMPDGSTVRIANFGAPGGDDWQVMRVNDDDTQTNWTGHYESFEQALDALERDYR